MRYICKYSFIEIIDGGIYTTLQTTEIPSIVWALEGFWVNKEHEFTQLEDNKYWIPPSQIKLVEKVL